MVRGKFAEEVEDAGHVRGQGGGEFDRLLGRRVAQTDAVGVEGLAGQDYGVWVAEGGCIGACDGLGDLPRWGAAVPGGRHSRGRLWHNRQEVAQVEFAAVTV
jgi:hypothetical protein